MKRLIIICTTFCFGILLLLAGCSKNNLPNIDGSLKVVNGKTNLSVTATFTDSSDHDLFNGNVSSYIALYSTGDEEKYITRKSVTIQKETGAEPTETLKSNSVDFTGLTADTAYALKLVISAKGNQRVIATSNIKTINSGASAEDPIRIEDLDGLLNMNNGNDSYYILEKDIDLGGEKLTSIFNSSTYFKGVFNGNHHMISNFALESNQYNGLFGYMSNAVVENLTLSNVTYNANRSDTYLGALSGYAKNCTIRNVTIDGMKIEHSGQTTRMNYIGGLVGKAENSTIENCSVNNLNLKIDRAQLYVYAGGFIGENENTLITDCNVSGTIEATIAYTSNDNGCLFLGGFAGANCSNKGIKNSYSIVNIKVLEPSSVTSSGTKTHQVHVGGFAGSNFHDGAYYDNCAGVGELDVTVAYSTYVCIGGFAGSTFAKNKGEVEVNTSRMINCIYVPTGKGINVTLMKQAEPKEGETAPFTTQEAYISLTVGRYGNKTQQSMENVISYSRNIVVTNPHDNYKETPSVVSTVITAFSQTIQNVIVRATA